MKCSLGISNFLEEISSLSHSVVFLYFFALITEEGFLIFSCYSLELCIQMGISFLFSFAFRFSSSGCEGDLVVTSVTPLIARVDLADLAGWAGVPFLPHCSMCVPPEAARSVEEDDHPR